LIDYGNSLRSREQKVIYHESACFVLGRSGTGEFIPLHPDGQSLNYFQEKQRALSSRFVCLAAWLLQLNTGVCRSLALRNCSDKPKITQSHVKYLSRSRACLPRESRSTIGTSALLRQHYYGTGLNNLRRRNMCLRIWMMRMLVFLGCPQSIPC
jgi:hypothetical protein